MIVIEKIMLATKYAKRQHFQLNWVGCFHVKPAYI